MVGTEVSAKIMVDLILYNRLGPDPTAEEVESLLNEYETKFIQIVNLNDSKLSKHLIDRLTSALRGESLYADWHKRFCKRVQEILKQS